MNCSYTTSDITSNESFLKVAKQLEDKGIFNNKFCLSLINQELIGVDPYDPNLTERQKIDITRECIVNVWYYLREVIKIPIDGKSHKFNLNLGNVAQIYCFTKGINTYTTITRSYAMELTNVVLIHWLTNFNAGYNTSILNNNDEHAMYILNNIEVPDYLINNIDKNNNTYKNIANNSSIETNGSIPESCFEIEQVAIDTVSNYNTVFINNFEYVENIDHFYNSIKNKGLRILITSLIGEYGIETRLNSVRWEDKLYDSHKLLMDMINENKLVYIFKNPYDLQIPANIINHLCKCLDNDKIAINREIILSR